jgi:2-polyprenyl-3-methyl-5-hydroxy-6-metoxy-1,4-benzoquinol methylase
MNCRHCGAALSLPLMDLGSSPPSNAYLTEAALRATETWYPLRVLVCTRCWLAQTEDHAGRESLFAHDYAYFSSFATSWLAHAERYVTEMASRYGLGSSSMVAEVAANDGYLLQYVGALGIPCYGIEPTASTATAAKAKGIDIVEKFFDVELAMQLAGEARQADLVVANNVLAHVPDINDFVAGFGILLKPDGVATFEFPHLMRLVAENQFDTIYHEHYSYLSLIAVQAIFAANGLTVFDVEELPTHGGSLRVHAARTDGVVRPVANRVNILLQAERRAGVANEDFYTALQARAERAKNDLLAFLIEAKRSGKKVGAYGAAAKGNTLLNFAGVRPDLLPWVVDRNPVKLGKYLPGSRIPIVDEGRISQERPDFILILPWNLREEIEPQLSYVSAWGGKFVRAIPNLVVSGDVGR